MKHQQLSRSHILGSCTTLLVMDFLDLVYIAAAVVLAIASKPSLQVDNVLTGSSDATMTCGERKKFLRLLD